MKVSAIVLAAGMSTRYGSRNKMLHNIDGKAMLWRVLKEVKNADFDQIYLVTGYERELVEEVVEEFAEVRLIHNPDFSRGMSTSIAAGAVAGQESDALVICLADMPYLSGEDYEGIFRYTSQLQNIHAAIIVPRYKKRLGHPVVFGADYFDELMNLPVEDRGAKSILDRHQDRILYLDVDHDRILKDVDRSHDNLSSL